MPDLSQLPLWANLLIFGGVATVVWFAGVRLARWAAALSEATGIDQAIVGLILLGGITSLPEVAVSVTAATRGEVQLAVNNLLGGLAFQVALIAIADAFIRRDALSSVTAKPAVLLQGTLVCVMLTVTALAIAVGDMEVVFGIGAWSLTLVPLYVLSVVLIGHSQGFKGWRPVSRKGTEEKNEEGGVTEATEGISTRGLIARITIAAVVVLVAGVAATMSAEAIAEQSGLGTSFVGAVLLAGATSFPELSTAIESVRLKRYSMAFSDVFGTNLVDAALIFVVDAIASGPPVFNQLDTFSLVAALLGVLLTMIYVIGLVERRDKVILRMGYDSLIVLIVYFGGLALLYQLR